MMGTGREAMDFAGRVYQSLDDANATVASLESNEGAADHDTSSPAIIPVVLSGGAGSRLWPYSTEDTPKQFLSFTGSKSLFQLTLERVADRQRFSSPIVVG